MITFNETNKLILSADEHQSIVDKFPEKLKPFLSGCNNPLDETQVLVNLFKDKNMRIILRQEEDEFSNIDYVSYYYANDLCKLINHDIKHMTDWKNKWNIKLFNHENLTPQFADSILVSNIKDTKIDKKAIFINEQDLKIVLLKINTREANIFQEWILKQPTITKALIKYIIKLKHEQEIKKQMQEQMQEQIDNLQNNMLKRTVKAVKTFREPIKSAGKIYIATSPEYIKQYMYKIGYTTAELSTREKGLQTSCPSIKIVYAVDVKDVDLTESLIHSYLMHLNVIKEFFYVSSIDVAKKIVNSCSNFVDNLISEYDNDYILLRKHYINNDTVIINQSTENKVCSQTRRIGMKNRSPKNTYDLADPNVFGDINNNLKFNNLYDDKEEKQQILNDLINTKLVDENDFVKNIENNSRTSKLIVKKYVMSKLFKLEDKEITLDFLNEWIDKEYILDNVAYALGKKKIKDDNIRQKIDYLNKILKVYGFTGVFDFETVVEKDDKMETRMKDSKILEGGEYDKLMACFGKRPYKEKGQSKFSVNGFVIVSDAILNEFGVGIKTTKKHVMINKQRMYKTKYKILEIYKHIQQFIKK